MSTVRNSIFNSFVEKYSNAGLQFVSIFVLARLLTPNDIGIYSAGAALVAFAHVFRDFGVTTYVIQEKELTVPRVAAALAITTSIAVLMGIGLLALSNPMAEFYDEEGVAKILRVLAINFFLIPVGGMAPALLRRQMKFAQLRKISVFSTLVSVAVSVSLALLDFGFMCMAYASVAGSATSSLMGLYFLPKKYRNLPSFTAWRDVIAVSAYGGGAGMLRQAGDALTELIIGRVLSLTSLGFYSRANGYVSMFRKYFVSAVMPVVHSKLAKKNRESGNIDKEYGAALAYVTVIAFPALMMLGILALPTIRVLFGTQWDIAAEIAPILCAMGMVQMLMRLNNVVMLSTGRTRLQFVINLIVQPVKILLVLGLAIAYGLHGAAFALLLSVVIHVAISSWFVRKLVGGFNNIIRPVLSSFAIALLTCSAPLLVNVYTNWDESVYIPLAGALLSGAFIWLVAVFLTKHPITEEIIYLRERLEKLL